MLAPMLVGACEMPEQPRQPDAKVDLRSMSTAIESYYIDHAAFPDWTDDPALSPNAYALAEDPELKKIPNFLAMRLTTPIAYLTEYLPDQYAKSVKLPEDARARRKKPGFVALMLGAGVGANQTHPTFAYWKPPAGMGYIVWSPGPDGVYDLNSANITAAYGPGGDDLTPLLVGLTYDPTNGELSVGDLWRGGGTLNQPHAGPSERAP